MQPAASPPPVHVFLITRYALLCALTHLIPVPFLDGMVDSWLRRRLTRVQMHAFGIEAWPHELGVLSHAAGSGCLAWIWSGISWLFKKVLRYLLFALMVKAMVDRFNEVTARAMLIHEACAIGALPGSAPEVRAAMDAAWREVDTRPLERAVGIVFQSARGQLRVLWRQARARVRQQAALEREEAKWSEGDEAPLQTDLEDLSTALARAIWVPEVYERLVAAFRSHWMKHVEE